MLRRTIGWFALLFASGTLAIICTAYGVQWLAFKILPVGATAGFIGLTYGALQQIRQGGSSTVGGESIQGFGNMTGMISFAHSIAVFSYGGTNWQDATFPIVEAMLFFSVAIGCVVLIRNYGEEWQLKTVSSNARVQNNGTVMGNFGSFDIQSATQLSAALTEGADAVRNMSRTVAEITSALHAGSSEAEKLSIEITRGVDGVREFNQLVTYVGALVEDIQKFTNA